MKQISMKKVIEGKRYDTETATLIADDVYWDGNNMERQGRNTWLYRTPRGAWFQIVGSLWAGEQDQLIPIDETEAQRLYEGPLPEHYMEWEEAFGREPEEPEPSPGRPPIYGESMRQTGIYLRPDQIEWLKTRGNTMSEALRDIVDAAISRAEAGDA